jgi:hypothetical protein
MGILAPRPRGGDHPVVWIMTRLEINRQLFASAAELSLGHAVFLARHNQQTDLARWTRPEHLQHDLLEKIEVSLFQAQCVIHISKDSVLCLST